MKRFRKKTASEVDFKRVAIERMQRFNPLRNVSPDYLRSAHEEFNAGRLKTAARLWDAVERTDDVCQVSASKRKKAVSRHGYEIVEVDDSAEAKRHAEVLRFFYDNVIASRADDRNVRGGLPLAVRNMMDAVGKRYAVHEIVWKPIDGGLTAELIFVPLWYFENTTGELRLLDGLSDLHGTPLDPGEWMIHSGEGIMEAVAASYMFKHLPLQDWLFYSEKFGMPIPKGKSPDQPDSDGWRAMEDAVAALGAADGVVISSNGEIEAVDLGSAQNLPYPPLIERMDRAIASLWRGADLGTISKGDGTGASLQEEETQLLEDDDAGNITDVLNEQLDRYIIQYATGSNTPKAWVKIKGGVRDDVKQDLEIDKGLHEMGYESPVEDLQRRYNRSELEARTNPQPAKTELANEAAEPSATAELKKNARNVIAESVAQDLRPVAASLADLIDNTPDDQLQAALKAWRSDTLPQLAAQVIDNPSAADAYADTLAANLINGYVESPDE